MPETDTYHGLRDDGKAGKKRAFYTVNGMMAMTDNDDMQAVYQMMMAGSRNHMRVFVGMIEGQGMAYNPHYISHNEMYSAKHTCPTYIARG